MRMTNTFKLARDQLKRNLAAEYNKENPDVPTDKVGSTDKTGKRVFGFIEEAFRQIQSTEKDTVHPDEREKLNRHLALYGDQRYQACLLSLNTAKRIVHHLSLVADWTFGPADRDHHLARLREEDRKCEKSTLLQHRAQQKFLRMMDAPAKTTRKLVCELSTIYFQAILEQLKAQYAIYKHECELQEELRFFAAALIQSRFDELRSSADSDTIEFIAETYRILKNEGRYDVAAVRNLNYQAMEHSLKHLENRLAQQRKRLESVERAIFMIERMVGELERIAQATEPSEPPEPPKTTDEKEAAPDDEGPRRMARFDRVRVRGRISKGR